jgi:Fic family protein
MLVRAREAIQIKRKKKLEKIMTLFEKKSSTSAKSSAESRKISNDQVEKFLHVSDSTATRYLSRLVKEGRIIKNEKKGSGTTYSKR